MGGVRIAVVWDIFGGAFCRSTLRVEVFGSAIGRWGVAVIGGLGSAEGTF
jgi:hypothetical protein